MYICNIYIYKATGLTAVWTGLKFVAFDDSGRFKSKVPGLCCSDGVVDLQAFTVSLRPHTPVA